MVKELRTRTGAGMMECKNALTETGGDMDAAIEVLRKKGAAKADKKAGRIAAEGVVISALSDDQAAGVLLEVNCETDFVAKDENFKSFAEGVARTVLEEQPADVDALAKLNVAGGGQSVEQARIDLINKIGENISLRRFQVVRAPEGARIGAYSHGTRIGVLVTVEGGRDDLGKDLAMHIAASQPQYITRDEVPQEIPRRREGNLRGPGKGKREAREHHREDGPGPAAETSERNHAARTVVREGSGPDRREAVEDRTGAGARVSSLRSRAGPGKARGRLRIRSDGPGQGRVVDGKARFPPRPAEAQRRGIERRPGFWY
jgi:translation elongation factor Ts